MKQARKKELKTNELSIYLQQVQEAVVRHANYIIGGVVAVVLILMIGLYVQSSRHQAETARWAQFREIKEAAGSGEIKPETLNSADQLANETAGDPRLGPAARELYAQLSYQKALDTSPVSNPGEYEKFLKQAEEGYSTIVKDYSNRPDFVARAHLGLGEIYESLQVIGKAKSEDAAKEYEQAAKFEATAPIAKSRLDTLPERTKPLKIVATLPAEAPESAPATVPAFTITPTTKPAAAAPATAPQ